MTQKKERQTMEESESKYKTREDFASELAFVLTNHDIREAQYLDVTQQILSVIQREDVIPVDKLPTWKSYNLMEEFADSIADERISRQLYRALDKRHPFGEFRYAAERTGVIQQWYDWRDRWQNAQAEEWMRDHGVDFKDGRIVCDGKHSFIWSWEDEDDEIDV